jgi:hypothetical protein
MLMFECLLSYVHVWNSFFTVIMKLDFLKVGSQYDIGLSLSENPRCSMELLVGLGLLTNSPVIVLSFLKGISY